MKTPKATRTRPRVKTEAGFPFNLGRWDRNPFKVLHYEKRSPLFGTSTRAMLGWSIKAKA